MFFNFLRIIHNLIFKFIVKEFEYPKGASFGAYSRLLLVPFGHNLRIHLNVYLNVYVINYNKKTGFGEPVFFALHAIVNEVRTRIRGYDGHIYIPDLK